MTNIQITASKVRRDLARRQRILRSNCLIQLSGLQIFALVMVGGCFNHDGNNKRPDRQEHPDRVFNLLKRTCPVSVGMSADQAQDVVRQLSERSDDAKSKDYVLVMPKSDFSADGSGKLVVYIEDPSVPFGYWLDAEASNGEVVKLVLCLGTADHAYGHQYTELEDKKPKRTRVD